MKRLALTIAFSLGLIGDSSSIPSLRQLMDDEEPNICLEMQQLRVSAKMKDTSSVKIINNLLDRKYLNLFPELDAS